MNAGNHLHRRDFLRAGSLPFLGLAPGRLPDTDVNCILLFLVGGPSHLDTWDPKPDAPAEIRGPYKPIKTNVPGIRISENFPRMARHADKYAIVRSLHHTAAPLHDTGCQLMQTGRLCPPGAEHPHIGCVVAGVKGARTGAPPHVLLPGPIADTGTNLPHGQTAGCLGPSFDPFFLKPRTDREPQGLRRRYGLNRFGQSCLMAHRLVESGVRFVTVNMFPTIFGEITWDIHGTEPCSPMESYRDVVCPMFDMACSALLEDLARTGLLATTMVVAMGEFGRTPKINPYGGRDHWTQCWSILMGGGSLKGGQVIGSSDNQGGAPKDRPVTPATVAATLYQALGIPRHTRLPNGRPVLDPDVEPIWELL